MFRHKGRSRTYTHNLKLAATLSFVAGIVNVAGFLAVTQLTTNVTGHFAFFVGEIYNLQWQGSLFYFLFIFFFFFGSFSSGILVELSNRINKKYRYFFPLLIEIGILTQVGLMSSEFVLQHPNWVACALLYAMGLQNSLVTTISNSIVRTTHLTGLFTDLGIELSQLFFYKSIDDKAKLFRSMKLRFTIIAFFFFGGVISGLAYSRIGLKIILLAAVLLVAGLFFDTIKVKVLRTKRKFFTSKRRIYSREY